MRGAYLCSSIGKKQLMAISGLVWVGFVFAHMLGNLLFLVGPDAYNSYGDAITSNHFYYPLEIGLAVALLAHIFFAALVVIGNRRARPVGYSVSPQGKPKTGATFASRTMAYSGVLILVFIILHLINFRFGTHYDYSYRGGQIRDLYRLMAELFASLGYTIWYLVALFVLSFHLEHSLWSSLQTLGLIPVGREKGLRRLSYAFGILVAIGFAVNPLYIHFLKG